MREVSAGDETAGWLSASSWESFYILLGTAAASLIGLLFVVVTLTGARDRSQALRAVSIYMTPTVVNFAVVLATSAVAIAPLQSVWATAAALGVGALVGMANAAWACAAMLSRAPNAEPPHWSDLWLYGVAPFGICLCLWIADVALWARAALASVAMAVPMLALLMLGIRNAWDLAPGWPLSATADQVRLGQLTLSAL